jgi:predicted acylesterase/phospholipase RssA
MEDNKDNKSTEKLFFHVQTDGSVVEIESKDMEDLKIPHEETFIPSEKLDKYHSYFDTLVLSGGSVRGVGVLGALHYAKVNLFIENINTFVGVSSGAMICYMLAIGYTPLELIKSVCVNQDFMHKLQNFSFINMLHGEGATSYNPINEILEKLTIDKIGRFVTLKSLKETFGKTLICGTFNYTQGRAEYLSAKNYPDMPCLTAIRLSANLPLFFKHYKYMGNYYIDGGIADNFPIQLVAKPENRVLGFLLLPKHQDKNPTELNILEFIYSLFFVPSNKAMEYKSEQISDCMIVKLRLNNIKVFNFDVSRKIILDMFSNGYQLAKKFFENKEN